MRPQRIISGGQTGVDRAALDVAGELGIARGGWCPAGRRAEDGLIPAHYPLCETPGRGYAQRTEWNVRDADATLVLAAAAPAGGTRLTLRLASRLAKPCLLLRLDGSEAEAALRRWLADPSLRVLNVAGPRESEQPGIYARAKAFLLATLRE